MSSHDGDDLVTRYLAERAGRPKRADVAAEVARLSAMFNRPRGTPEAGAPYLACRLARAAYAAYFAPANAGKVAHVLRELGGYAPGFFARPALRVVDLGCGTGAAGLGLAAFLNERGLSPQVAYEGIDACAEAAEDARWFLGEAAPAWAVETRTGDMGGSAAAPPADLVFLIDALNETAAAGAADPAAAGARLLRGALGRAAPDGYLIVVEPALRTLTRSLHAVRDALCAEGGVRVAAPCLHDRPCPALARAEAWCHEERAWDRPGIVGAIDRQVGHDKRRLKYAYLVLTRAGRTLADAAAAWSAGLGTGAAAWRAVGNRHDLKGKTRVAGCNAAGWCDVECLARNRSDDTRAFFRLERGDVFGVGGAAPEPGSIRLRLDQAVARWAEAGETGFCRKVIKAVTRAHEDPLAKTPSRKDL